MIARTDVTAIVLAGGRASRFGGDKLHAELSGMSLLDRAITAVAEVAEEVVIAGPARPSWRALPGTSIRSVVDAEPFAGPLAALAGALSTAHGSLAIVVGGDMPALVPAVLELLLQRVAPDIAGTMPVEAAILAAQEPGAKRQVLPLAIHVAAGWAAAGAALAAGDRSLVRVLDRLATVEIRAAEWLALDPAGRTLVDVDAPADLDRLRDGEFR